MRYPFVETVYHSCSRVGLSEVVKKATARSSGFVKSKGAQPSYATHVKSFAALLQLNHRRRPHCDTHSRQLVKAVLHRYSEIS